MRFTKEKELMQAYWDDTKRIKTKFLWWPMTIDGETRWLETTEVMYKVRSGEDIFCNRYYYWSPMKFMNE